MSMNSLSLKYISATEHVLKHMEPSKTRMTIDPAQISNVVDSAKAYFADARYYREKKKFGVSLTSVAYCEGLLDALRLLGAVKFDWPVKANEKTIREK